jgi:S-adenosyl methyltransferase
MSVDITRPHIARIYDYMLGGTYNYDADRRAVAAILDLVPAYPRWARLNRAFLGHVGRRWAGAGFTEILDLGSGLTTQGHFNEHLPAARILFADSDPLTVAQGHLLLTSSPDMAYVEVDIRDASAVLERAAQFFGEGHRLAVGLIGIVYFLSDDDVRALVQRLHAFCAPGSSLAFSYHHVPEGPDHAVILDALLESARVARVNLYVRTTRELARLVAPWRLVGDEDLADLLEGVAPPPVDPAHPIHKATLRGAFAER